MSNDVNQYIWAEGYLVVEAVENQYGVITSAKFAKVTNREPQMNDGLQRAVRVRMRLPKAAFEPIADVRIEVPQAELIEPQVEIGAP